MNLLNTIFLQAQVDTITSNVWGWFVKIMVFAIVVLFCYGAFQVYSKKENGNDYKAALKTYAGAVIFLLIALAFAVKFKQELESILAGVY